MLFLVFSFLCRSFADLYELDIEDKGRIRLDGSGAAHSISEVSRDKELDVTAFADELQTLSLSFDHAVHLHAYRIFLWV